MASQASLKLTVAARLCTNKEQGKQGSCLVACMSTYNCLTTFHFGLALWSTFTQKWLHNSLIKYCTNMPINIWTDRNQQGTVKGQTYLMGCEVTVNFPDKHECVFNNCF